MKYSPINLDYFLEMEVASGGPSKAILNLGGKLKKVKDIVEYWKTAPAPKLTPDTWQYYNCMIAGFKHNVANHHELGWDKLTKEYYDSLEPMSDDEIEEYLRCNPVEFTNGFIKHSYHRAYAMIGRLVRGEKYIPFYMLTEQIYDKPRPQDGKQRIYNPTTRIKLLSALDEMGIDRNEYCLCQSAILSVMGIRENDDLDIIISSRLRKQNLKFPNGIEVFAKDRGKFDYFGASGDDDILQNYCVIIGGYKFLEPRFYFARKNMHTSRDRSDMQGVADFFSREAHLGYPFNFQFYKWGLPAMAPRMRMSDLDLDSLTVIRDKYNRVVDGVNQGRVVYAGDGYYVKIFHPDYCRLQNFRDALSSGFLNGLAPSLHYLIEDDEENIIGYITLSGDVLSNNGFEYEAIPDWFLRTVLRNCQKRKKLFYDLVPTNIIRDRYYGQIGLVDLESVYDLNRLSDMELHNAVVKPANLLALVEKSVI